MEGSCRRLLLLLTFHNLSRVSSEGESRRREEFEEEVVEGGGLERVEEEVIEGEVRGEREVVK